MLTAAHDREKDKTGFWEKKDQKGKRGGMRKNATSLCKLGSESLQDLFHCCKKTGASRSKKKKGWPKSMKRTLEGRQRPRR